MMQPQIPTGVQKKKSDLNLTGFKISLQKLETQFECTVCLNAICDCYVTRCGHVFCRKCIEETINRHHRCPFCNQQLTEFKKDVFKNYHFNTIKKIIEDEKDKERDKYISKVFATDLKTQIEHENQELQEFLLPIQRKIVEMCEKALLHYRGFALNLLQIEKQAEEKKVLLGSGILRDHKTIARDIQQLITGCMTNPIIAPEVIEKATKISILLPGNRVNESTLNVSPLVSYSYLIPHIESMCSSANVKINGQISDELLVNGVPTEQTAKIGLNAGRRIHLEKGIPFKQKVYCFTFNWFKEKKSAFMICQTCNVKWICENCALFCHSGHQTKPHLNNHQSEWAICYCATKCNCKAINKNVDQQ